MILPFPTPEMGGPVWKKFTDSDPDWDVVTTEQIMDDGGADYNREADSPIYRWSFEYGPLLTVESDILDEHRALAKGKNESFTFVHPRTGITYIGVRYEKYERGHDSRHVNTQVRMITLIKRP